MNKKNRYSYGRQNIDDADVRAVIAALKSDWITQGPRVQELESIISLLTGSAHVTCVSSGTAALHLTGLALGWQPGDIIITSPITFLASANCIIYCGASPDFVDIDPVSFTLDVNYLEEKLKSLYKRGLRVRAVIAVDYAGHPCNWESLRSLADRYGFQLVDDACHAIGASYKGNPIGSGKYADVTIFSFHAVKTITTGEGGAILTNDEAIHRKTKQLRNHGIVKERTQMTRDEGPWYYEMHDLGFNYRITDIQCALGISQFRRLNDFLRLRRKWAAYYDSVLGKYECVITPVVSTDVMHAYHLYPLQIHFQKTQIDRKILFTRLQKHGIHCQVHFIPVHLQPYYASRFSFRRGDYPCAEAFYERQVSLPMYPGLEEPDLAYITESLMAVMTNGG